MLFNTIQFAIFFTIVYSLYVSLSHKWQNRMLLAASYIFYGTWNWKFLSLIIGSTILDYICGIKIYESKDIHKKKVFLYLSLFGNLSVLGFFKYFNFFISSFQEFLNAVGFSVQPFILHIILPVGISFYTFQTMSYTIDIYKEEMNPTKKFFDFALFVAFFPQLVAGPIERAKHLLPQMLSPRKITLNNFYEGCYLILWGLFQKVFVADNLARIIDPVFAASQNGSARILLALYAFAFQILCDFAGYSNIARGLGKVMGFEIMVNFNLPYFSTNPQEFWRRWHISLSYWFRDYLYIPLGGNKKGILNTYKNLSITMFLCGLWHGAAWTFVIWGIYHGVLLMLHRCLKPYLEKIPSPKNMVAEKIWFLFRMIFFFHLICLGWLIFRAQSMSQVFQMLHDLCSNFEMINSGALLYDFKLFIFFIGVLIITESLMYWKNDLMVVFKFDTLTRTAFYLVCFYLIMIFGISGGKEFVYFQF